MKTVAVLGASSDPAKFGNKAVRAYLKHGYQVYPVHPKGGTLEGCKVYRCLEELPESHHTISVYLPPSVTLGLLPTIAELGCRELWLNPGADSPDVVEEAKRCGLNVIQACSLVGLEESGQKG